MEHTEDMNQLARLRRMAQAADAYSFWVIGPVEESPHVELAAWRVMQLVDGSRHLVGTSLGDNSAGRVSSRIVCFDALRSAAVTDSGRVYQLVGAPGRSSDNDYVWARWVEQAELFGWMDVTSVVVADILRAQRHQS